MRSTGPDLPDGPLTLHFDPDGPLLDATIACEQQVFKERYDVVAADLAEYYRPYTDASSFLAIADESGEVLGMSRIVFPGPASLVTLVDIAGGPWQVDPVESLDRTGLDADHVIDIATVAVRGAGRPSGVSQAAALYHGLIQVTRANEIQGFVALLDQRVRRMLAQLGVVTHMLPGTKTAPYWGSTATTPCWANMADLIDTQRRRYPDAHRLVTLGVGLGDIAVPPLQAFRRRDRRIDLRERERTTAVGGGDAPQDLRGVRDVRQASADDQLVGRGRRG